MEITIYLSVAVDREFFCGANLAMVSSSREFLLVWVCTQIIWDVIQCEKKRQSSGNRLSCVRWWTSGQGQD
jgi:hypothetical protein